MFRSTTNVLHLVLLVATTCN
eukprot:SAG11_NODE_19236_length_471_cov_0.970430_1_plen_20_part_10